jgi:hypothetical protein
MSLPTAPVAVLIVGVGNAADLHPAKVRGPADERPSKGLADPVKPFATYDYWH